MQRKSMHCLPNMRRSALMAAAVVVVALASGGCSTLGPKPWEKDLMAKKPMQVDAYAGLIAARNHIYFSKEASSGGSGFAGGGCGCN